jgi:5-methylcytosine-specific restriction protein B
MAIITNLVQGHQNVHAHPTSVEGYVQILQDGDGRPLVHVSTWGSENRTSPKKQSQVIQFDAASASELVKYFVSAFGRDVIAE